MRSKNITYKTSTEDKIGTVNSEVWFKDFTHNGFSLKFQSLNEMIEFQAKTNSPLTIFASFGQKFGLLNVFKPQLNFALASISSYKAFCYGCSYKKIIC